jgi:hypothetical protein
MDHILGKMRGVKTADIKAALAADAAKHSKDGLALRHVWHNADDTDETLFIFTASDLEHAREVIEKEHSDARKENPNANLPELLYLKGV